MQVHDPASPAIGRITARLHRVGICHQAFRLICIPKGLVQARSVFQANHSRNFTCHREPNFRSKIWYPEPKFGIDLGIDFGIEVVSIRSPPNTAKSQDTLPLNEKHFGKFCFQQWFAWPHRPGLPSTGPARPDLAWTGWPSLPRPGLSRTPSTRSFWKNKQKSLLS